MTEWMQVEELVNALGPFQQGANDQFIPFLPMYVPLDEPFIGGLQSSGLVLAAWRFTGGPVTVNSLVKGAPAGQQ